MTDFFQVKKPLYPLFSLFASLLIFIGSLLMAKSYWGGLFLALQFILLVFFGYGRPCFFILPFTSLYSGFFSLIFYFASGRDFSFAAQMAVRFAGVSLACIPCLALPPVALVRNLTALGCPRLVTLGMLITLSFIPVLTSEIRQVRGAMKTRGATSFWRPAVFYRAFLIPLVVRLVNISDTLTLSLETRAFVCDEVKPKVYKSVKITLKDVIFLLLLLAVFALSLFFAFFEVRR